MAYFAIYLPWFLYLEKHVTTRYHVMHSVVDDWIPFNEYFIIPYFLWFAYIAAVILFYKQGRLLPCLYSSVYRDDFKSFNLHSFSKRH